MIINDLNVVSISFSKTKANSPLIVDRNGVLPRPPSSHCMKPVAGRHSQILQARSKIDILEPSDGSSEDLRRKPSWSTSGLQLLRVPVREGLDHDRSV